MAEWNTTPSVCLGVLVLVSSQIANLLPRVTEFGQWTRVYMEIFLMRLILSMTALCLALACSAPLEPESEAPPAEVDIQAMLEREANPIAVQPLSAPNGSFEASAPGILSSAVKPLDSYYEWFLDIGSGKPIGCWLYPDGLDMANALKQLSDAFFDELSTVGELEGKQITGTDAGDAGGVPYVGVQWVFQMMQGGVSVVGQVSARVALKQGVGVACVESELGFEETFKRVFGQLVASLELRVAPVEPYYSEIAVMRVRGQTVGVQEIRLTLDEDGDTRVDTTVALALPTSPTDLMTNDQYDIQYSTPEGDLINQWTQIIDGGEMTTELSLKWASDEAWTVEGTFQQKEIDATIEGPALESMLGQMNSVKNLIASGQKDSEVTHRIWVASIDPTQFIEATTKFAGQVDTDSYRLEGVIGPITLTGISDPIGSMESAEIDMGPIKFELERVHQFGNF
jgi:hypothetical protein